jgi:putative lipase involved disintegration of autophagic bodies
MYVDYYLRSLSFEEMFSNMDVIFPTIEDKKRIEQLSGVEISDANYQRVRKENRAKNQPRIRRKK